MRSDVLACALLASLPACGGDAPATTTPTGEVERARADGTIERWAVAADGVADGAYRLETADGWRLRDGAFARGQPTGTWTDWYGPDAVADGVPQAAMRYGFVAGLADGDFVAWEVDGALRWERSWAAGRPCGTWRDHDGDAVREMAYPPCDGSGVGVDLEALALVSPRVTDFGWDGQTCPAGAALVVDVDPESGAAADAAYCARGAIPDGPAWWRRGDAGDAGVAGELVQTGHFALGVRAGVWVRYHPRAAADDAGQRIAEAGEYVDGERQGEWRVYRADGTLELEGDYRDGLRDGAWEGYAPNLLLAWLGDYAAGQKTGVWRTWHADWTGGYTYAGAGTVATEETWVDGVRHGPFTHWFRGGGKAREGAYVAGLLGGVVTTWWEDGPKRYETTYVGGIASGPHRQWDEDGRLEAEGRYLFGQSDGVWSFWSDPNVVILHFGGPARRTRQTVTFSEGVGDGPVEGRYDEGGALAFEGRLVAGSDEGPGTFYWPSGQVLAAGVYQGGDAQGPWQSYYESGAPRATWPYVDGVLFGPFVERYESGQKRREGSYYAGRRSGTWTRWDEAGVVVGSEDCGVYGEACDCAATEACQ